MTKTSGDLASSVELSGPFFTHDPAKTFLQNVRVMMEAIAAEGEAMVRTALAVGQASRAPLTAFSNGDRVSMHAIGRVHAIPERGGRQWSTHAVISVNNSGLSAEQGKSLMAAAAIVERKTHAFRSTAQRLRASSAVNQAELAKGLE